MNDVIDKICGFPIEISKHVGWDRKTLKKRQVLNLNKFPQINNNLTDTLS